jgi:fructose-1,6-bisphosphatase I
MSDFDKHDHPDSIRNDVDSKTLSRIAAVTTKDPEFVMLLGALQTSCKLVARSVRKAGIAGLYGAAGTENATGDSQKKLDVLSNDMFVNALYNSNACAILVSEENDEAIFVEEDLAGSYCIAFDPLDGSSNIDCNVSTGTIFAIWKKKSVGKAVLSDIVRPGSEMYCAGYCAYGSATELVLTYGHGVQRFTLDPSIGEFILTAEKMLLPAVQKTIYSVNEGNYLTWDENMKKAVDDFRMNVPAYTARYVGSMVSDVHRTLMYGGVYLYPADAKKGNGKLRILYEGFPMAMIIEQAGGDASTGVFRGKINRVLDLMPEGIHDKCPILIGSPRDVQRVLSYYR